MESHAMTALHSLQGCVGWLTALLLIGVGLVSVRKAYPTSGYLLAVGGALRWLFFCCDGVENVLFQADAYELLDLYMTADPLPRLLTMLVWLLSTLSVLAGIAVLVRQVAAKRIAGGAA